MKPGIISIRRNTNMPKRTRNRFFTTKELRSAGWLKEQLRLQANGLSGNLDKVWPDIKESRWIGGSRDGWERVPYWLDGFIPLAWLLDDPDMKKRAKRYIDAILAGQKEDGWICPCQDEERAQYDMWAMFLICKVLVLYHDCTGDERVEDALYRALKNLDLHIDRHTLFNWSAARWFECLIPLLWLMERRPEEPWMLDLAFKLKVQGFDYRTLFRHWRFQKPYEHKRWTQLTHVVNLAMCLKSEAVFSNLIGQEPDEFAEQALELLLRDHGMAIDHFSGDECLSGTSPIQGTELCSITEAMYSYEWLLSITGNSAWADRLENLAFNALPATISPDMWSHQYDQMTNQVQCTVIPPEHVHFRTNSGESHLFGLEPNFGCCTANFNQGWPKFALSTWTRTEAGLAVGAIAPSTLRTMINGVEVTCEIVTNYPFEDGYKVIIHTDQRVEFALDLRIPGMAKSARINGNKVNGPVYRLEQVWNGDSTIHVDFDFIPEFIQRPGNRYCVRRGPLLYALPIKEQWNRIEYERNGVQRKFPYCDYEILPLSPWNYIFADTELSFEQGELSGRPFDPANAPVSITVNLLPVEWPAENGVCAENPTSTTPVGTVVKKRLIPYGCTNLRITEMLNLLYP
jgi:hypothetical protein